MGLIFSRQGNSTKTRDGSIWKMYILAPFVFNSVWVSCSSKLYQYTHAVFQRRFGVIQYKLCIMIKDLCTYLCIIIGIPNICGIPNKISGGTLVFDYIL